MTVQAISLSAAYLRPDLPAVAAELRALALSSTRSRSDALLEGVRSWNRIRSRLDTARQIASVRYHQDTRDPDIRAEEDFWNESSPLLRELDVLYARTLLGHPDRARIDQVFGPQFLALKECTATTFAPEIKDAIAEEARLFARYTELCALPEVKFRGEALNLSAVAKYFVDADRQTRLEAQQARDAFLRGKAEELDELYDRLVKLRDGMARALGFANFVPLGYKLLGRTGYGPSQVATFRAEIRRTVLPLAQKILRAQARRMGLDRLLFHDEPVADPRGNPRPLGDGAYCLAQAQRMYRELGTEFGEFFDLMLARGLLDVENRAGKAGGGFCTVLADLAVPFVFANFNGTDGDVRVLTHECGHAFQAWQSRQQPLLEYLLPTYEAAEIHSMSMEYLTYPWMHLFFGEDEALRYQRTHLEQEIVALPYMAAVDHFQHEVYSSPGLSPKERCALWLEMEKQYLPHRDYGGLLPYLQTGTVWQRQLHLYGAPFYYIDYALAETCALQLWHKSQEDRPAAVRDYLAVCEPGGSLPFEKLVSVAGLTSPLVPGCLERVTARVREKLQLAG
jgi:M3 family oligoendopeptidase